MKNQKNLSEDPWRDIDMFTKSKKIDTSKKEKVVDGMREVRIPVIFMPFWIAFCLGWWGYGKYQDLKDWVKK